MGRHDRWISSVQVFVGEVLDLGVLDEAGEDGEVGLEVLLGSVGECLECVDVGLRLGLELLQGRLGAGEVLPVDGASVGKDLNGRMSFPVGTALPS